MVSQRLADASRLAPDPAAIAKAVCGVQAQDSFAGTMQLRVRSTRLTAEAVERAVAVDRSMVRTWLMRGTLHLCAAEDIRWLLGVFGPMNARREATRRKQLGLDDSVCERGVRVMRRALANGPMTRHELRAEVIAKGVPIEPVGQSMIHLLAYAAHRGAIVLGPRRGRDSLFVLLDDWLPPSLGPSGDAALAELARRYFAAYGPASVQDLATWSGLPMAAARHAMTSIAGELGEFAGSIDGVMTLRTVKAEAQSPGRQRPEVRLLPHFDTYLLGYRRRDLMIDMTRIEWLNEGGGGWIRPMVCVDGWLVGGWRLERGAREIVSTVRLFEDSIAGMRRGLDAEVRAIGEFLGVPARWVPGVPGN